MSGSTRGILMALLAFAIFASHDVIVKILGAQFAPFQVVFFSVLFGFPLTTVILMRDGRPGTLRPVHPWWMILRTAAAVVASGCTFYAFSVLPLADTYAILFATPLLITVIAIPILGERVRLRRWIAVLVGLTGVIVVLQPGQSALTAGHAAALVAAICSSLASVIVRKIGSEERSVVMLLYPMMANFVLMGALMPWYYKPVPGVDLAGFAAIAGLSIIAGLFMIAAYKRAEAALVAPMQYSQIIWATFYGYVLFDQLPGMNVIAGAGLIILSGLYIVLREAHAGRGSQQPVLRTRNRVGTPASLRVGPMMRLRRDV